MDNNYLFDQWLISRIKKADRKRKHSKPFIGERGYPHFDNKLFYPRVGNNAEQAALLKEIVTSPELLAKHGFLPFIKDDKRQRKYTKPYDYDFSAFRGRDQKLFPHLKSRPIMYASHKDACIFSFYSYTLELLYEQKLKEVGLETNIIAYRSIDNKNNVDHSKVAFDAMSERTEYDCLLMDVKGFFDNLEHIKLRKVWEDLLDGGFVSNADHRIIFQRISSFRYISQYRAISILKENKRKFLYRSGGCFRLASLDDYNKFLKKAARKNQTGVGIPQGSPISGVLANMYLIDFDIAMKKMVEEKLGGIYQRYSDDIFVLCPRNKASEVYKQSKLLLRKEGLSFGLKKTEAFKKVADEKRLMNITNELEPGGNGSRRDVQYLGLHYNGKNITLRPSTVSKHIRNRSSVSYFKGAYNKTKDSHLARQVAKIRRNMKQDP